ncbi:MAG: SHOCT domain-containing protein [Bacteroidales bacterium]
MTYGHGFSLLWLIIIVAIIILVVVVIVNNTKSPAGSPNIKTEESPLKILKRRYAKGEISRSQFEEMRKDIEE